MRQSKTSKRY